MINEGLIQDLESPALQSQGGTILLCYLQSRDSPWTRTRQERVFLRQDSPWPFPPTAPHLSCLPVFPEVHSSISHIRLCQSQALYLRQWPKIITYFAPSTRAKIWIRHCLFPLSAWRLFLFWISLDTFRSNNYWSSKLFSWFTISCSSESVHSYVPYFIQDPCS